MVRSCKRKDEQKRLKKKIATAKDAAEYHESLHQKVLEPMQKNTRQYADLCIQAARAAQQHFDETLEQACKAEETAQLAEQKAHAHLMRACRHRAKIEAAYQMLARSDLGDALERADRLRERMGY